MVRNRRTSTKMNVVNRHAWHALALILMSFMMGILNLLANSQCNELTKDNERKAMELKRLEADCRRENVRWDSMHDQESLVRSLREHGMRMDFARALQNIRMNADGRPCPGQYSVAKARSRVAAANFAQYRR